MCRVLTIAAVFVFIAFACAWGTIINIPADYPTIQQGIDASINGDTVLVQPGTYVENVNFNGHNIVLGSLFLTSGDTAYISSTAIDGGSSGSVVTFDSGEDSSAVIIAFTIRNGFAQQGGGVYCDSGSNPTIVNNIITMNEAYSVSNSSRGGGICCIDSDPLVLNNSIYQNTVGHLAPPGVNFGAGIYCLNSNMKIIGNRVYENEAYCCLYEFIGTVRGYGGGIYSDSSSPVISGNEIYENTAESGGGIYSSNSTSIITDNIVSGNLAGWFTGIYVLGFGGGIICAGSQAEITANRIIENVSYIHGGGISIINSDGRINANVLVGNNGGYIGGSLYLLNSDIDIINNTLSENYGGGIYCADNSNPAITNNILWANCDTTWQEIRVDSTSSTIITYCDVQDTLWPGIGNISVDPLFRDPENGDFHLMATYCGDSNDSPCIDAGDPAILDSLLDCSLGMGWYRSDMGAYGGGDSAQVDIDDLIINLPERPYLHHNYPNPFNASTTIKYELPYQSSVTIDIYNILGRKVETLIQGKQPAGYHQVVWDASGVASGIYLCRMSIKIPEGKADNFQQSQKLVLLK